MYGINTTSLMMELKMLPLHRKFIKEQDMPQPAEQEHDVARLFNQPDKQPQQPNADAATADTDKQPGEEKSTDKQEQPTDQTGQQTQPKDPDHQGLIRTVKGAHLVYKRESSEGTFEELWIYNVGKLQDELKVRRAILAGTDIPPNRRDSPDGKQSYDIWSTGNAELLHVEGLPN